MIKNKYEKLVITSDWHLPYGDEKAIALFKEFIKEEKPDRLIIAGDFIDFAEISDFRKAPIEGDILQKNIDLAVKELTELRKLMGRKQIDYIEGNHTWRLKKYLINHAPELSGLKNLKIENLLQLDKLKVKFYPVKKEANRFQDNFLKIENLYIGHFDKANKGSGMTARRLLLDKGVSVLQSHCHRFGMITQRQMNNNLLVGAEVGCLCSLNPSYLSNPDWCQGFVVLFYNKIKHKLYIYPIMIDNNYSLFWGNTEYSF